MRGVIERLRVKHAPDYIGVWSNGSIVGAVLRQEITEQSLDTGRSPAQCGTACPHQTEPWCLPCTLPTLTSPRPGRNQNTRTQTAAENTLGLRQLYLTIRKVTWTHQSIGSLPFCSCHRGPSATHPAPAHQYSHYRPAEGWHKRSHEIKRYSVLGGYQIQGSAALPTVLCLRMLALDRVNDDYNENTNTRSHLVIVGEEGVELFHCKSYTLRTEE